MAKAGGHQQEFDLSHPANLNNPNDMSDGGLVAAGMDEKDISKVSAEANRKWFEELAKADERGNRFRIQVEELQKKKAEIEDKLQQTEKQVFVREEEIKRLYKLYEGGSNLEVLSVKHTHETNEKTIAKLANQVDFLNRENHTLQQQVLILKGDSKAIKTLESYETEIKNLNFESQTLRKDLAESSRLIRDYQEKEILMRDKSLAFNE